MAKVTHVSINKQDFVLGANPKLKINIITENSHIDKLQFIVEQRSGSERLMVSPINRFMLLLTGVEDVDDSEAILIVKEHRINQWQEVKRMRLFDGRAVAKPLASRAAIQERKPQVLGAISGGEHPEDGKLIEPNCHLDYDGQQTLWRLGSVYAKAWELNTYGAILAIYDANPKAFTLGKINSLRADVKLDCPSLSVKRRYLDGTFAKQRFEGM
jgi:hypothetical protein